jgi:hypothetical protein
MKVTVIAVLLSMVSGIPALAATFVYAIPLHPARARLEIQFGHPQFHPRVPSEVQGEAIAPGYGRACALSLARAHLLCNSAPWQRP